MKQTSLPALLNGTLVEAFGDNPAEPHQWFKPAGAVISWAYYHIKYKSEAENVKRLALLRPTTYDIRENVKATIAEYAGKDWEAIMRPHMDELAALVGELERRGCRVLLFELPVVPELRDNSYVRVAHRLAHEAFPVQSRWLQIADEDFRWVDAAPMDEQSDFGCAADRQIPCWSFALVSAKNGWPRRRFGCKLSADAEAAH